MNQNFPDGLLSFSIAVFLSINTAIRAVTTALPLPDYWPGSAGTVTRVFMIGGGDG